jgi:hypothetical protein
LGTKLLSGRSIEFTERQIYRDRLLVVPEVVVIMRTNYKRTRMIFEGRSKCSN